MPKDKTLSHQKIIEAAKKEFLEKGFEGASIRAIGERVGMTSAALYRHCKDKEDLFYLVIEPAILCLKEMVYKHKDKCFDNLDDYQVFSDIINRSEEVEILKYMGSTYKDEMKLLICHSQGTRFSNFVEEFSSMQCQGTMEAIKYLRKNGRKTAQINEKELHMLISSYTTAMLNPIINDFTIEEMNHCYDIITEFFAPGWIKIMGM